MNALKHRLTLEMTVLNSQAIIHIKKDDTQNKLIISLTENNKPYEITENVHAAFVGKKPDGKIVFNDCDIAGNTIEYTITAQTSVAVGTVNCELRLYDNNNNLLTAPRFALLVDEIIYDGDKIQMESENEINVLDSLLLEANAILEASKRGEFNGKDGKDGADGATFTPSMNAQGVLSWSNDKGLENPMSYNFHWDIINNAGWTKQFNGTPNLIGDNRWYKIEEYLDNLQIGVRVITTEGEEKQYRISPEWAAGNRIAFRFKECTIKNNKDIHVKIDVYIDMGFFYGYRTEEFTISTDDTLEKIDGVYFISPIFWRNGPADGKDGKDGADGKDGKDGLNGKDGKDGADVDLSAYLTTSKFNDYINGFYTTPHIITDLLNVLGRAVFEHTVVVQEPVDNNNPATKKYVDNHFDGTYMLPMVITETLGVAGAASFDGTVTVPTPININNPATKGYVDELLSYFNGDQTVPMAVIQTLGVLGEAIFEGVITVPPPETDNNPTTKKYVDDAIREALKNLPVYNGEVETE